MTSPAIATCPHCGMELKFSPEGVPIVCDLCAASTPRLVDMGLVIPDKSEVPDVNH